MELFLKVGDLVMTITESTASRGSHIVSCSEEFPNPQHKTITVQGETTACNIAADFLASEGPNDTGLFGLSFPEFCK